MALRPEDQRLPTDGIALVEGKGKAEREPALVRRA